MSQSPVISTTNDTITRSNVYKLLSLGFRYPTPETFETFKNGELLSRLWDNISSLPYTKSLEIEQGDLINKVQNDMAGASFTGFEVEYIQTFDAGSPEPPCPPYEGIYRKEERTEIMLEVSEFYKYFGLRINQEEGKCELPDHLCAELEFLHFLAFKEAQARDTNELELLKGYLMAQKDFLERHLMQWVPKFYDKLQSSKDVPSSYAQLARIMTVFIERDFEYVSSNLT